MKRDFKKFAQNFNRNLSVADWRTVYQRRNCNEIVSEFNINFLRKFEINGLTKAH